jgi:hypothetical protein
VGDAGGRMGKSGVLREDKGITEIRDAIRGVGGAGMSRRYLELVYSSKSTHDTQDAVAGRNTTLIPLVTLYELPLQRAIYLNSNVY